MAQKGALFPWRTINGEEASAYYAAGTAQVHIDADVAYALTKYVDATGDTDFLVRDGIDILVQTARLWADLGFWRSNGDPAFHIHGVTGPDEYTTVVNNNLFTNVMARYNLERAAAAVEEIREYEPDGVRRHGRPARASRTARSRSGPRCAEHMTIRFDEHLGIHPQDDEFLDREVWDLSRTPTELRPLLLHYHPLVIYRFQVLKQADVVLALFLQGDRFTLEQKKADFEYYDPITTGDSTLSAVVQCVIAAEVGYHEVAADYFTAALYVDLADLHENTVDGVHVASAGGVWTALVNGFAGMRDHGGLLTFDPRLPDGLAVPGLLAALARQPAAGARRARTTSSSASTTAPRPWSCRCAARPTRSSRTPASPYRWTDQGPRIDGKIGDSPLIGGHRADGTEITAGVPEPSYTPDEFSTI